MSDAVPSTPAAPAAPTKKKRRIFLWFFLAVQVLFLIWVIAGGASHNDVSDCGTLSAKTCNDAQNVGKGIGVFLIIVLWFFVDAFLGVVYGVYRLAKRS